MKRRRWLWLGIPLIGIIGAVLLSPTDRYAALDEMGTLTSDEIVSLGGIAGASAAPAPEATRFRAWEIRAPSAQVDPVVASLVAPKDGWRRTSSNQGAAFGPNVEATIYENGRSRDIVAVIRMRLPKDESGLKVTVIEEEARGLLPKFRRWIRRVFSR